MKTVEAGQPGQMIVQTVPHLAGRRSLEDFTAALTGCSRSTSRRLLRLGTKTTSTNLRMRNISWLILAGPVTTMAVRWSHLAISCCFSVRCMRPFFLMIASSTPRTTSSAILST